MLALDIQNQHTLSQAAEKIALKPSVVQEKFFQLIEFLVHHLHFIPTKELIGKETRMSQSLNQTKFDKKKLFQQ